jgi:hypothetical protein
MKRRVEEDNDGEGVVPGMCAVAGGQTKGLDAKRSSIEPQSILYVFHC